MCLNEYSDLINYKIYCYHETENERLQLQSVAEFLQIKNIKFKKIIFGIQYLQPFLNFNNKTFDKIIIGNYFTRLHRLFVNYYKPKKIVIVDDGLITLKLDDKNLTNKFHNPYGGSILIDKILGITKPFKFELFTIFNLKSNSNFNVVKNNLSNLKKTLINVRLQKTIIIIGQPLVEKYFTEKTVYLDYLKKIKEKFKGYRLLYFPSRKESKNNIEHIKNTLDFEVITPEVNIELYLIKHKIFPEHIVGISTTALFTLSLILKKTNIETKISYYRLMNFTNFQYSLFCNTIYYEFEQMGIKKLSFEDTH